MLICPTSPARLNSILQGDSLFRSPSADHTLSVGEHTLIDGVIARFEPKSAVNFVPDNPFKQL
jgi:hypothetical protein